MAKSSDDIGRGRAKASGAHKGGKSGGRAKASAARNDGKTGGRARAQRDPKAGSVRRAIVEITSSIPGKHQHTQLPKPEDPNDPGYDGIETGELDPRDLTNWRDRAIGFFFWVAWFAIGVYAWWFTDARPIDYVVATAIWLLIFAFAVIGVPLVRMSARGRANR